MYLIIMLVPTYVVKNRTKPEVQSPDHQVVEWATLSLTAWVISRHPVSSYITQGSGFLLHNITNRPILSVEQIMS
jgi:hypothetical protein